ncbi:hypothetical protein CDAR_316821, partial [Caerostris darwini]
WQYADHQQQQQYQQQQQHQQQHQQQQQQQQPLGQSHDSKQDHCHGPLPRDLLAEPTTTASKRLQKAWQLSDAEARDLSKWQKAAHHRFEVLQSVAAIDPARMSSRKRRRTEETNRPNLSLDKLMDTTDLLISPTAFARLGRGVLAEAAPDFHSFPVGSVLCSYYRQFFWLRREFHFAGAAIDFFWPWHMTFTKHRNLRNRIGL